MAMDSTGNELNISSLRTARSNPIQETPSCQGQAYALRHGLSHCDSVRAERKGSPLATFLFSNLFDGFLCNLPRLAILRDDGTSAEVVVDALGEESLGGGLAVGSEDSLGMSAFLRKRGLRKLQKLVTVGVRLPAL